MLDTINTALTTIDDFIWGLPLIIAILAVGLFMTFRLKGLQVTKFPLAVKELFSNEKKAGEDGKKYPALRHCVRHFRQPSVREISSVLQRLW